MARVLTGVVSADSTDKTITVTIHERRTHPLYKKQYSVSKKFHAHDEQNQAHVGDRVEIEECRPISKTKTWKLNKIVEKSQGSTIELKDEEVLEKPVEKPAQTKKAEEATGETVETDAEEIAS